MGAREAGLDNPGAFPACQGFGGSLQVGSADAPSAAAWPGMWISRVSRQVTNSAVTQAGQSIRRVLPHPPTRGGGVGR